MSSSPLRPQALPATQRKPSSSHTPLAQSTTDTISASSSVTTQGPSQNNRADQVVYRFYLKTVAVLGEARLTHYGNGAGKDKKKDKWFNLSLPETDLHRAELAGYRSISSFTIPRPTFSEPLNGGNVPPLLVAFILDTSDLPGGQALIWNRESGRVAIDTTLLGDGGKGKAKEKEQQSGIILERWTLRANPSISDDVAASQMAAHTAYRYGIIHFRTLYALVRLLPSYRLFRRLRRANNGLRLGIKLWSPEGYLNTPEELAAAWEVMERDLVPIGASLDQFVPSESTSPDTVERYEVPSVDLFGMSYSLGVDFRTEVDFTTEDKESVLSEKFVDMDEDWFKPTVARHRLEDEAAARASGGGMEAKPSRRVSHPTAIPTTSPIPQRQQAAAPGSFGSIALGGSRPSGSRLASGTGTSLKAPGSQGSGRWGALAEGLPFASPSATPSESKDQSSINVTHPHSGASVAARRLSGHSIGLSASPSTSLLRSTPPIHQGTPPLAPRPGTSVGRTSSFLSQSGRSFTHAQLANMSPPVGSSPPIHSPISPSSLSFTKQPVARSLSVRTPHAQPSSSPIIPGSFEKDGQLPIQGGSAGQPPFAKRYSTSLSQRPSRLAGSNTSEGVLGASASPSGGHSSHSLLRRTSTRTSQESGLRHSATPGVEDDEIQSFLKTLDTLPQPPTVGTHAVHGSRSHLPSTTSSLSGPSHSATPSPLYSSRNSPSGQAGLMQGRVHLTRAQLDDQLRKMAGSFELDTGGMVDATARSSSVATRQLSPPTAAATSHTPSVGLISASRPMSAARRRISQGEQTIRPSPQRYESLKSGSPLASSPAHVPLPDSPTSEIARPATKLPTARSLPDAGSASLAEDVPVPSRTTATPAAALSPQTTGTSTTTNQSSASGRRGPVLLRGGFEGRTTKPSASSSPSHSPIRDFARMSLGPNRSAGHNLASLGSRGESISLGYGFGRKTAGQRTAPSSFGVPNMDEPSEDEEARGARGRRSGRRSEGGLSPRDEDITERSRSGGLGGDW